MKILITVILLFFFNCSFATNRYFSNAGNDTTGTGTIGNPYRSIAKLNALFAGFAAGDSILFRRGDTFFGTIYCSRSGGSTTPMVLDAYGVGAKPIITGFQTLSSWTLVSGNIYQASVTATNRLNMVTVDGIPQEVARFPNYNTTNGGYLTYTAYSGATSLTAAGLNGFNFTGGEVVARKNGFLVDRQIITAHTTSTITTRVIATINPRQSGATLAPALTPTHANFGLYIQRLPSLIDTLGEWYYDTTAHTLKMYFVGTPTGKVVKVAVLDTLLNINNKNFITVKNLDFEGANMSHIYYQDNQGIVIVGNDMNYCGIKGIFAWNSFNDLITNNTFNYAWSNSIDHTSRHNRGLNISYNTINHVAEKAGMGYWGDNNDFQNISISVDSFAMVSHNNIFNSGYGGIVITGSKVNIDSNYINTYAFVKDDIGAIYTYGNGATLNYGRNIRNNIILNGMGAPFGNGNPIKPEGVYTDGGLPENSSSGAAGIELKNNTIINVNGRALYHNDPKNIYEHDNTIYNSMSIGINKHYGDSILNYRNTRNIFFNTIYVTAGTPYSHVNTGLNSTHSPVVSTIQQSLQQLGLIDSNYWQFAAVNTTPFSWFYYTTYGGSPTFPAPVSYATWQSYTGHDTHSTLFAAPTSLQRIYYNPSDTVLQKTFTDSIFQEPNGTLDTNAINIPRWGSVILMYVGKINQRPIVSTSANQTITQPITSAPVSGTATDPDGTITALLWSQLSGPATVSFTTPTANNTIVNGLTVAGSYSIKFKATGSGGASDTASATMLITVNPAANVPPVISPAPIPGQTITAPASAVTATVSATDADGSIASRRWFYNSGPTGAIITNGTTATATFSGLTVGIYSFGVTVKDNSGDSVSTTFQVMVNPAVNVPPVISPNPVTPQTITAPTSSVTATVSATDADGTIVNRRWYYISGPAGFTITNGSTATATFSGLTVGIYSFGVTVKDNSGDSALSTFKVTVNPAANVPPVIFPNPVAPQTITAPTSSVTATVAATDADGTIVSRRWYYNSGPSGAVITNGTTATATFSSLTPGIYSFGVTVKDNSGDSALSTFQVTVNAAPNIPPVISPDPVTPQTITAPTSSTSATVFYSDADGTIVSKRWYYISGPAGSSITNGTTATATFSGLTVGTYSFGVTIIDNSGDSALSTFALIVNPAIPPPNIPPVISPNPVTTQTLQLPTNSTTATVFYSDADGTVVAWLWTKLSGPATYTLTNATTATASFSNLVAGTYNFKVRVLDNSGDSATATFQLIVNPAANIPPTINAITNKVLTLPTNSLSVTAVASDADGTIVSYSWSGTGPSAPVFGSPSSATTTIGSLIAGTYNIKIRVTDNSGDSAIRTFQILVNPAANVPPTINAISDKVITLPTNSLSVTAVASDADGTITSYSWSGSGPSVPVFGSATLATTTIGSLIAGTYNIRVRVIDNSGDSAVRTFQILVNPATNVPPTINPISDKVLTLPTNSLSVTALASDIDGTIVSYNWSGTGPSSPVFGSPSLATTTIGSLIAGTYNIRVRVTDNSGDSAVRTFQIQVNPAVNIPPVISPSPIPTQTKTLPTNSTTATVISSDVDGTVVAWRWNYLSGPALVMTNRTTATCTFSSLTAGVYNFSATVFDNSGDSSIANFQIIVNPAPTTPPVPNAGTDATFRLPTTAVTLAGSGIDGLNCPILTHTWTLVSSPVGSTPVITTPSSYTSTFTNILVTGKYTLRLTLTSACSVPVYDDIDINVLPVSNSHNHDSYPTFKPFQPHR